MLLRRYHIEPIKEEIGVNMEEIESVEEEKEEVVEPIKCNGVTKSGKPCKSYAVEGSDFCFNHRKQEGGK